MTSFVQDLRGGVRGLLKSPLSTFVAALTIAVGIGVNTTMFSIVEAVLLKSIGIAQPQRLIQAQLLPHGIKIGLAGAGLDQKHRGIAGHAHEQEDGERKQEQ